MNQRTAEPIERKDAGIDVPARRQTIQASYLAHELRAPLTAVRLGLEILQEQTVDKLAADEKHLLNLAVRNTARLELLVNDIMDYAKLMAGKMALVRENVDARALVSETVASLRPLAANKGMQIIESVGELPRVFAEPRRVIQVLTNLLSNAIKFTPAGGSVTVSVQKGRGEDLGKLIFSVKDTGCGISSDDQRSVFDAFSQSAEGAKKSNGTGLGLTLARSMVELHGGRIWIESQLGQGSTFSFTIPVTAEDLKLCVERRTSVALQAMAEVIVRAGRAVREMLEAPNAALPPATAAGPRLELAYAAEAGGNGLKRKFRMAVFTAGLAMVMGAGASAEEGGGSWRRLGNMHMGAAGSRARCGLDLISGVCGPTAARGLSAPLSRLFSQRPGQPGFMNNRIAQAFIDDVKIASLGDWVVKLRIELK